LEFDNKKLLFDETEILNDIICSDGLSNTVKTDYYTTQSQLCTVDKKKENKDMQVSSSTVLDWPFCNSLSVQKSAASMFSTQEIECNQSIGGVKSGGECGDSPNHFQYHSYGSENSNVVFQVEGLNEQKQVMTNNIVSQQPLHVPIGYYQTQHQNQRVNFASMSFEQPVSNVDQKASPRSLECSKQGRLLPQYFWQINGHSQTNSLETAAGAAEYEVGMNESEFLAQDVRDRTPDPVKLLVLRAKMQQITGLMDNLHTLSDNSVRLKAMKKKEKNRLASKCCRLKKKALFEANLIILNGLMKEKESVQQILMKLRLVMANFLDKTNFTDQNAFNPSSQNSLYSPSTDSDKLRDQIEVIVAQAQQNFRPVAGRKQEYVKEVLDQMTTMSFQQHQIDFGSIGFD
ncbi:MAG: hypothetical protein MHPSP_003300, partial [Paramarteilia canceri]